jgi:YidC/Oxa1 family membrane protein insertase
MDKNTITGLLLIFLIFVGYTYFTMPSEEELAERRRVQDSLFQVKRYQDSLRAIRITQQAEDELERISDQPQSADDPTVKADLFNRLGYFANAGVGEQKYFTIENELIKLKISRRGGKIVNVQLKDYVTYDSLPLFLYNNEQPVFGYTFFAANRTINTDQLFFEPYFYNSAFAGRDSVFVSGNDSVVFGMRLYVDDGDGVDENRYLENRFTLKGNSNLVDYDLTLRGLADVIDPGASFINLNWKAEIRRQEASMENERNETTIYYKYFEDDVDYLSERKDVEEKLVTPVKWLSFKSRFFLSTFIADEAFRNADIRTTTSETNDDPHYLRTMEAAIGIPYDNLHSHTFNSRFYFGPNKYSTLKKFKLDLERQVPLGWGFFLLAWINIGAVIPVFDWLGGYGWNYGIVILILTLLLKLVLFPIAYKTYLSSARMRVLKPEIEEISKKYPKTEDAMKKQQATMSLYKKAGVNPLAGCLPMLLQMPILIAMFRFFPSSIELRQQSFLWATDLSSYDSVLDLPFTIPFYGDHVSLFTLLMTISTIIYTKINNDMMGSANPSMPGMKTMMYIMPVMFLGFFNSYASALSYYYLLTNLITFAQMYVIRKSIDEDKIRRQIMANKKKPVKKSKFQERLEQMAKQRGYDPKTGKRK